MTVLIFALPIAGVIMVQPQPARAQGLPTIDIASITGNLAKFIKDVLYQGLTQGAAVAFKNALKVFVSQIAYDTAVWIGSGDANQKPLLYTENAGQYLLTVGDAAAGEFVNTLFDENGYAYYDLCQPGDINAQLVVGWAIAIAIPEIDLPSGGIQLPSGELPTVECTFTDIIGNFQEASLSLDFATNIALIFIPSNNDFGVIGTAIGEGYSAVANSKEEGVVNRLKNDFLDQQGKISGYTATPSSAIEHQYFLSLDASSYPQTTYTGKLVADTLDIFTSTLISKLLERLKAGLISDFTTPDITDSLSGSGSTSGGVTAAEEKFLTFTQVPVTRGSSLDILGQMTSCPDQGADVVNCVIDSGFASAATQGKTVLQALDEGLIDGAKPFGFGSDGSDITYEEGIPYRSIIVLKHYRIVPVGWQIAAEYLRDFGGGSSLTLQDLVDAYDQCSITDYSPYCGLVDPDWVLVSPEGLCNIEAYGQNILSARFEDDDGVDGTPERNNVLRGQSCVDDQSCLKKDSDGNCMAFGYCQEEKRIYRFQGDECAEQYSSCQTYEDSTGEEVSYLRDTINFNNCDAGTVGCQWYCTVYNEINLDWQCSENGSIYSTCDSSSSTYDATDLTCACTASDASTCDMQEGAFSCTTDTSATCTLGTEEDVSATSGEDSAINFNNQLATCESDDAGCTTFVETTTGANLIFNSSFEYFDSYNEAPSDVIRGEDELTDTTADSFGFYAGDSSDPGTACFADTTSSSGPDTCIGWQPTGTVIATSDDVFDGFVAAELTAPATLNYTLETGYALADRTFDLTLWVQNTAATDCEARASLQGTLLTNPDYTGTAGDNMIVPGDGVWTQIEFTAYTEPSTTTDTSLTLRISQLDACTIKVDAVDLSETDDVSDYTDYGTIEEISMNGDVLSCDIEDIGCELFTPVGGSVDETIPGQITNPLSDACTGTDGFASPDCSQCDGTTSDDQFVGCDFYQEQPLTNAAPIPDMAGFSTPPSATQRDGIVQRTGSYCNNAGYEGVSCYGIVDCGGTAGACVDSISIIPSTAEICSTQYVGCEEYTNLDTVAEGGEGIEYYSYIRQCVKDTPEQRAGADGSETTTADNEIHTYVTFEGSDVSGYSLRSFNLKQSNLDTAPCTNLDLYGTTAETSEADCIDDTTTVDADGDGIYDGQGIKTCTAADIGVDPDCTEFIDPDTGTSYYRLSSYTVSATDDCHAMRNTLDGRTYFSVPSESTECPAGQNLCREYKGSAGGDVFEAINEDFEDTVWNGSNTTGTIEQSSESAAAGGHSMHLSVNGGTYSLATYTDAGIISALDEGKTYIIKMWMKESGGGTGLSVFLNSNTSTSVDAQVYFVNASVNSVSGDAVTVTEDTWKEYTFGPVIMPRAGEEDDELVIYWAGATDLYVDNVVLEESDAQYLIKNTAETCAGYEGCQDYTNRNGDTEYIKSFTRLCEEQFVGCEALLTTQNSDSPFAQIFLDDNSFTSTDGPTDDVIVSEDEVVAYVNDEANYCAAASAGCMELGLPEVDETTGLAESFITGSYINDPDSYDSILCETDALWCDEFTSTNDEVAYFKDPGSKTCEYRQATDSSDFGWFVSESDDPCPLFDESANPGQPMGAICDNGTRDGLFCNSDSDCTDDDTTDTITPHCRSDFATDADINEVADSGWTGTCAAAYSGCTEYQDPNTDNLIPNGSFEEDQYTFDSTTYSTDTTVLASDGVPDYFEEVQVWFPLECDTFGQTTTRTHTGSYALEVIQDGLYSYQDGIGCAVRTDEVIDVDTSKTYTMSANILLVNGSEASTNPSTISIGLLFFNEDGTFINPYDFDGDGDTYLDFDDYAAFSLAARSETVPSGDEDTWLRFSGQIGNRLEMTWPSTNNAWGEDVAYARPYFYAYTPDGSPIFIDDWSLTENSSYFYINTTVDGAPESDTNTCNGEVEIGQGCVAFRDVTNDSLTYLSTVETEQEVNSDDSVSSCTIGATDSESENCRFNADTADSNVVLEVASDRECAQWLTCKTASITTDANGNEETTCFDIDACDELSSNGLCANHLGNTDEADLTDESDLTIPSLAGATDVLDAIQNLSGYATVGLEWASNEGTCTSGECVDGPYEGSECSGDTDCTQDVLEQGYYPYQDMPQVGQDGLSGGDLDLISNGDFETVACGGTHSGTFTLNGAAVNYTTAFAQSRDVAQLCTLDDHCENQDTETRLKEIQTIDQQDPTTDISASFNYSSGWCSNPDAAGETWQNWAPTNTDTLISVVDYDPTVEFENPTTPNEYVDTPVENSNGSTTLDLNNVLYVEPSDSGEGVKYTSLDADTLVNDGSYVLSFRMAYDNAPSADDALYAYILFTETDGSETGVYFHSLDSSGTSGNDIVGTTRFATFTMTMTMTSKPENTQTADLIISTRDDTPFYIDDVSMLPTLGINQDLNNVARECRAFPAEDALMCNYSNTNGAVYAGIHGYCVEQDGLDNTKCITWWPVDLIAGDTDTRSKETVRYGGRVPLYYCAVAKGLQDLAVCDGGQRDGALCSSYLLDIVVTDGMISYSDGEFDPGDNYCQGTESSGQCTFGEIYRASGDSTEGLNVTDNEGPFRHSEDNNAAYRLDGAVTNATGYQANIRSVYLSTPGGGGDSSGEGLFMETAANPVEQALTLSDISDIVLEYDYYGSTGPSESVSGEWPAEGHEAHLGDETDEGDEPSGTSISGQVVANVTVHDWDDGGGVVGRNCEWINNDIVDGDGFITYVWNANNQVGVDPAFCAINPFAIGYTDGAEAALDGSLSDEDDVDTFFWIKSTSDYVQSSHFWGNDENLIAVQMTFEDAVLTSVQHILYSEIGGDDVDMKFLFKYQLQETCAYVVQAVDDAGDTTTWMERISSETGYRMPNTGYTYTTGPTPFGSIQPPTSGNPDVWDGDGNTGWNANTVGGLIVQRTSVDDLILAPLACVGICDTPMCVGYDETNASTSYQECPDNEGDYATGNACSGEGLDLCAGAPSYVSDTGAYSNSHASDAGIVTEDDQGTEVLDFNDQLFAAALVAREDLKFIFPDLIDTEVYVRDQDSSDNMRNNYVLDYSYDSYRGASNLNLWTDSSGDDIFDNMDVCSSSTRSDSDYCGIRPEVSSGGITVNDQVGDVTIDNGESVTLRFGMSADGEQEPITDIYIEFEGDPESTWSADSAEAFHDSWQAAASDDMAYSNSYACDPNVDSTWEDEDDSDGDGYAGVCVYEVRIQVIDSWNFCSGNIGDDDYEDYRGPTCQSYDKFSGHVVVSPD